MQFTGIKHLSTSSDRWLSILFSNKLCGQIFGLNHVLMIITAIDFKIGPVCTKNRSVEQYRSLMTLLFYYLNVLMVSFCDRLLSVVRCPSSTFCLVNTLEATFIVWSSGNFVRTFVPLIPRLNSKLGHVGSKTRSLGQKKEKPCEHCRSHIWCPIFM